MQKSLTSGININQMSVCQLDYSSIVASISGTMQGRHAVNVTGINVRMPWGKSYY